ncbi:helicase-associated domain-containing protein [Paenibacillus wynnii]|uniref:Helicase XPB/Ssl2 N-terminal domain-containing protein n=1 Tax=Paenibacillus wynnii TaxID=268407 RepID=A0A098M574_9BACL|nr:helicase-associated domain-containing protein [Paenibacillus wynnii]KGE16697.1 hypothetical protein PWYN_18530 [Paenibacillus wynnii]
MIQLTAHAQALLKKLHAAYAGQPFEEGKEEQFRPLDLCRAEQRLALSELRQAGFLAALLKMWGEKLYYIPEEHLSTIQSLFFPYAPYFEDSSEVHIYMEEGIGLANELFQALLFVEREGLPITGKGSIHKKNIARLTSKLTLQDKHLRGLSLRYPSSDIYTLPAAVMLDLMLCLGLIKREESAYILCVEVLESWLNLSESVMSDLLFNVAMKRYGSSDPAAQHFRYLIARPEFVVREWFSLTHLLDWMESSGLVMPIQRAGLEASSLAWLECLAGCGWCQVGTDREGGLCFRWIRMKPQLRGFTPRAHPVSASPASFIVQTDFEVLVPPDVPYYVRWCLACCAELLSMDSMWSYRLSREQLELAYDRRMPPDKVISWLDEHTVGGLPQEVRLVLEQWGKDIGRTSFADVLLLSCREEEDADAIAAHPRLQGLLCRLGLAHFSILREHEQYVRKELIAAGLAPPNGVQGREAGILTASPEWYLKKPEHPSGYSLPSADTQQGLMAINSPLLYLQPAPLEPDVPPLMEEESIPSMWFKELHRYHTTTAQKIMEQALNSGIKVRLSIEEEIQEFIPTRIKGNPWRIAGYIMSSKEGEILEERELPAGSWNEMQLIIPRSITIPPSVTATGYVMINETTHKVDQHYT